MEDRLKRKVSKKRANDTLVSVCADDGVLGVAAVRYTAEGTPELLLSDCDRGAGQDGRDKVLEAMVRKHGLQKKTCVNVLSSDNYQLIQSDLTDLPDDERREAARWQISERIDYPPQEAVIDLFDIPSFGGDRKPLTYVVSAEKRVLQQQVRMLADHDLELDSIDVPEFALRNLCDLFKDDPRGVAILLLLDQKGILVIARDGVLYLVRIFNTGMEDLIPYGDGNYEALSDLLDAVVLEIQRSFDHCESTFMLPTVSRLLVAQTGEEIPAVVSYLNEYLAAKVEPFSFPDWFKLPEGCLPLELNRNLLAIGGALRQENP